MTQKSIVFSATVRGFHVYKMSWKRKGGEILECLHEENNLYDVFSIEVCKSNNAQSVARHLPMEYQGLLNSYYKGVQEYKER